jgi:hypothetical protein
MQRHDDSPAVLHQRQQHVDALRPQQVEQLGLHRLV